MPMIRQMIRLMSGLEPKLTNPDTIVAQGASILADLIVNNGVSFSEHQDGKTTETDIVVVKGCDLSGNRSALQEKSKQELQLCG